jgi:glycerol-3-phosphate dehydrogenase (NAD(P)+)
LSRIAILGAGAWGTALTISLARRGGHELVLWSHNEALADSMLETGRNTIYLPNAIVPADVQITADLPGAIFEADILLCVTPSQHLRSTLSTIAPLLTRNQVIISASKGIEDRSFHRMSQVIASCTSNPVGVLSGPSFAQEVATGHPTAIVAAASDGVLAQLIQTEFTSPSLRVYTNDDITGVELGGALKNVIALAAGVVHGLDLGANSAAALITRGIAEITRLSVACGGRRQTLAGLSGVGDLRGFFDRMKQAVTRTRDTLTESISSVIALTRESRRASLDHTSSRLLLAADIGSRPPPPRSSKTSASAPSAGHRRAAPSSSNSSNPSSNPSSTASPPHHPSRRPARSHHDGRRQRHRQDHHHRQARRLFTAQGRTVLLCAADTFRAAAIEQLEVWASAPNVPLIKTRRAATPPPRSTTPAPPPRPAAPRSSSSTPPAASTPRPTS